jgi:hypothetical protein
VKGMVAGEPIKAGGASKEYDEGFEKAFGEPDAKFPRGRRFVWSTTEKRLVPAGFVEEKKALDAPVMAGRFYENTKSPIDGADIGSRKRHQTYMRDRNLAPSDDFKGVWAKEGEMKRRIREEGILPDRTRRDDVGRALHKLAPE